MKNIKDIILSESGFWESFTDASGDPIFIKDNDSKFLFANQALCDMLGLKPEQVIGKTLAESLPPSEMEHFLAVDKVVLNSGVENIVEEPLTRKGGKILTIVTRKIRYVDGKGNKYLIGVIHDITKQQEAENLYREKIKELEKINKLMVGRELEMINLKKQLAELKNNRAK